MIASVKSGAVEVLMPVLLELLSPILYMQVLLIPSLKIRMFKFETQLAIQMLLGCYVLLVIHGVDISHLGMNYVTVM